MDENVGNPHFKRQQPIEPEPDPIQKPSFAGKVVRKKQPIAKRFVKTFLGETFHDVVDYVIKEVLAPALKDMIVDAGTQAIQRTFYGDSRPPARSNRPSSSYHTNYRSYSTTPPRGRDTSRDNRGRDESRYSRRGRDSYDLDDIYLAEKADADGLLDALDDRLRRQDSVSVAQLYDLMEETISPTDETWGWFDLSKARIMRSRERGYDGWKVILPPPVPLDE